MRRKRLGEPADRQKVKALLKKNNPGWMQTRLSDLKMGFNTENSIEFISESLGVSDSSVKRWFATYRRDGLDAVLYRDYGIGRPSSLDEEIERYLQNGLDASRSASTRLIPISFNSASVRRRNACLCFATA